MNGIPFSPFDRSLKPLSIRVGMMLLGGFSWMSSVTHTAKGDVVWIRGQESPVYGQIIATTETDLQIRVFKNGKYSNIVRFEQTQIEQTITNIDPERLSRFAPQEPTAYRDYAEELASQRNDPSAIHLARRLYLIAGSNSSGEFRRSSLLGLIAITESEIERNRLQMLQFLTDSKSSVSGFSLAAKPMTNATTNQDRELMLKLVRSIRRENRADAIALLNVVANRTVFELWNKDCNLEEFDRMTQRRQPSKPQLRKLLAIERQIVEAMAPQPQRLNRRPVWGDYATQTSTHLGSLPNFRNVIPFSPERSIFRNGEWVEPTATKDR